MERFWEKILKTDTCWIWIASKSEDGYGYFRVGKKTERAHKFAFVMHKGAVPVGLEIDHLCRNRSCVNPNHLEAVTHKENCKRAGIMRRMSEEDRKTRRRESSAKTQRNLTPEQRKKRYERKRQWESNNLKHLAKKAAERRNRRTSEQIEKDRLYLIEWRKRNSSKR